MIKNVLITGATGNLGTAVVGKFLQEGYKVIGTIRRGQVPPDNEVDYFPCDLTDSGDTRELFNKLKGTYKTIHAGIFLVGGFSLGNIEDADGEKMTEMIKINFLSAYHSAYNTFGWMKQSYGGTMVFVGAKPALEGPAFAVLPYAISKKAVVELAQVINEKGAENGVRARVIVPNIIDTPQNRKAMPDASFEDWVKPETIADAMHALVVNPGGDTIFKIYDNTYLQA